MTISFFPSISVQFQFNFNFNSISIQIQFLCSPEGQQLLMIAIRACMPALCTLVSWETKQLFITASTTALAWTPAKRHTCVTVCRVIAAGAAVAVVSTLTNALMSAVVSVVVEAVWLPDQLLLHAVLSAVDAVLGAATGRCKEGQATVAEGAELQFDP